jgi:hypothetical protein
VGNILNKFLTFLPSQFASNTTVQRYEECDVLRIPVLILFDFRYNIDGVQVILGSTDQFTSSEYTHTFVMDNELFKSQETKTLAFQEAVIAPVNISPLLASRANVTGVHQL